MPDPRQSPTDDNPFAAPPEDRPDQPWQPRDGAGGPGQGGQGGDGGPSPEPGGPAGPRPGRWDPTDPAQRRARYALLGGMWAFFFVLFGIPSMGLLLGALSLYWGISSLRAKTKPEEARPQLTAAVAGLLTAAVALVLTVGTYTVQLTYKDFYTCRDDALTKTSELKCNDLLPKGLRDLIGVKK
ncbi:hypothetical protein LG634_34975 [Streptomyces bambusae]|uniref:hypothetical protein n=1 Tax=Streptomyces bambusae TaxID=1550616 RepID=UPI001CFFF3BF|nr:hypothetical protein [Streptomyces bambusae]MCB5169993.1 hypothetical protein [Streptomyces bambusae]